MNLKKHLVLILFLVSCQFSHTGYLSSDETIINDRFKSIHEVRSGGGAAGYVTEKLFIYDKTYNYKVLIMSGRGLGNLKITWEDKYSINIGYDWETDIYYFKNRLYNSEDYRCRFSHYVSLFSELMPG